MRTGDIVVDDQGKQYQLGSLLGRGLWGKTYRVQIEGEKGDFVLKCPLSAEDLAEDPQPEQLAQACGEILDEQALFLEQDSYGFVPRRVAHFSLGSGERVLVTERQPTSFEQRLQAGTTFAEALAILVQVCEMCQQLKDGPGFHGALSPDNILLSEDGAVILSDVATPAAKHLGARLQQARGAARSYLPPEIVASATEPPFSPVADTYALGMMIWRAAMGPHEELPLPREGLEKAEQVALRNRLHQRIKQEDSNPRFHTRLADRLVATVGRAISKKASPSPPYRFHRPDELQPRIEELLSLVRPEIASVGRIILDRAANTTHFSTDEKVRFTMSVGCSAGVDQHEEIGCGVAIFNRDTEERLREIPCTYDVKRHPSGRFRFSFVMEDVPPGRFRLRLAVAIRDSGHEPSTKEAEFEVRAAHGYNPPIKEPPPAALPMRRHLEESNTDTVPMQPAPKEPDTWVAPRPKTKSRPKPTATPAHKTLDDVAEDTWLPDHSTAEFAPVRTEDAPHSHGRTVVPPAPPVPALAPPPGNTEPAAAKPPAPQAPAPAPAPAAPAPQPKPQPEPEQPRVSWTELPLSKDREDDLTDLEEDFDDLDEFAPKSAWKHLTDMIMRDAFAKMMVVCAAVILVLLIAILAHRC